MNREQNTASRGMRASIHAGLGCAVAFAAALLVPAAPAAAQDGCGQNGEAVYDVCGTVTTSDGQPVANVTVVVTDAYGSYGTGLTDPNGFYAVGMGEGTWNVTVDTSTIPADYSTYTLTPPSTTATVTSTSVATGVNFVLTPPLTSDLVPSPCDFLTSGGFVFNDANKKVSFGAHGGCKNGEFWGHINIVDHATGYHINSDEITGYVVPVGVPGTTTRDICGWATTNLDSAPVRFRVRLTDNGEPGSLDEFGVVLASANNYLVTPRLLSAQKPGGGNVQLHKPNPSTIAPSPLPSAEQMCGGLTF